MKTDSWRVDVGDDREMPASMYVYRAIISTTNGHNPPHPEPHLLKELPRSIFAGVVRNFFLSLVRKATKTPHTIHHALK